MAKDNEVIIKIRSESDGSVKASIQETDKLTKSTEGATGAKKKGTEAGKKFHKQEKALYQGNLSSAKGFSKMKETISGGGSSSLVAAYATLAANVFAATAAFNALRTAAQVHTLVEGFEVLANVSGRTSEVVATGIREIAQGALSMEDALRASALAMSSGFSTAQLQELTEVATNASVALGRNLGDSVDRLIRGVAKLEPEILDELGIMVRLDTAVEKYAATIGKSASALTDFERRQAFLNESITQGQQKFGMMEDAVELSPFEKLGATFTDLANNVLGSISTIFGPLLKIVASSQTAMMGLLIMFGSGILTTMIPALGNLAARQTARAHQLRENADLEMRDAEAMRQSARAALEKGKSTLGGRKGRQGLLEKGEKASVKEYRKELNLVNRDITTRNNNTKKYGKAETKRRKKQLADLKLYKKELEVVIRKEEERARLLARGGKAERSIMGGDASSRASERIGEAGGGMGGSWKGFKIAGEEFKKYRVEMEATAGVQGKLSKQGGVIGKVMNFAAKSFMFGGTAVRIFGAALINAIPFIGQIIFVLSLVIQGIQKLFGASEKAKAAQEAYNKILDSVPDKIKQIQETQDKLAKTLYAQTGGIDQQALAGARLTAELEVMAGMTDEFMTAQANLNEVIAEEGVGLISAGWLAVKDSLRGAISATKEFFVELGKGIKESRFGQWWQETFSDIGTYDAVINNVIKTNNDWENSIKELGGESTLQIALDAQKKSMDSIAKKAKGDWGPILKKAGGSIEMAYRLAEEAGIDVADATAYLGTVAKAGSVEVTRQVKAVTTLGDTGKEAGKKIAQLNAAISKKNQYREAADQWDTFRTQITEAADVLEGKPGAMADRLVTLEAELDNTSKKLIQIVGGTGTYEEQIVTTANRVKDLADAEETYAEEKQMLKAFSALEKAITKAETAMISYQAKLEGLRKTGKFALTAEGEVDAALAIAAVKLSTAERELNIKLVMIRLEYDLMEEKIRQNTDLYEKIEGSEELVMKKRGRDLLKLNSLSREAAIGTINATTEAARLGIASTIAATRAGAGQKGTTIERVQALTKKRIDPEVLAAEREKALKAREAYMKVYNDPDASAESREIHKAMADAVITDIDKIQDHLVSMGGGVAILGSGTFKENINQLRGALTPMLNDLRKLGPEGEFVAQLTMGGLAIADSFDVIKDTASTTAEKLGAVASIIGQIGAIMAASSKAKIAGIDKEIEAEKRRDGKSASSLAKIKQMEAKKEAMARKAFEQQKSMNIAAAMMSTAGAIAGAYNAPPIPGAPWNIALAVMMGALGLAQVAIIKKQKFQGGSDGGGGAAPQAINIGKRSNRVDVAKGPAAGELSYLRGEKGIGSNIQSFTPTSGAAGMIKNYAAGGILVGEQGPEIVSARGPVEVTPNEAMGGMGTTNANFTINAVDAAGVEEVLTNQRGNIISMIREAAHDHGEEFLEPVNTDVYSDASSSGTWGGKGGG